MSFERNGRLGVVILRSLIPEHPEFNCAILRGRSEHLVQEGVELHVSDLVFVSFQQANIRLKLFEVVSTVDSHSGVIPRPDSKSTITGDSVLLLTVGDLYSSKLLVFIGVNSVQPLEVINS